MNQPQAYQPGETVRHPRRPEWGRGVIRNVETIDHQGQPAQRVTVDFPERGRTVINTAVVALEHDGGEEIENPSTGEVKSSMTRTGTFSGSTLGEGPERGWLNQLENASRGDASELWRLPENMTDPFRSAARRLEATLHSYRFTTEPRSLIEWAMGQTGLNDPLTKYTRQELEQAFPRFARDRDQHLRTLVRQMKRNGEEASIREAANQAKGQARQALVKAMQG